MVNKLKNGLFDLGVNVRDLLEKIGKHRKQLGQIVENFNTADASIIRTEHEHLEEEITFFVKSFRNNRKEVFTITEYVIDSEKLPTVMDALKL